MYNKDLVKRIEKAELFLLIGLVSLLVLFMTFETVYPLNFLFLAGLLFTVTVMTVSCVYLTVGSMVYFLKNGYKPFKNYIEYKNR